MRSGSSVVLAALLCSGLQQGESQPKAAVRINTTLPSVVISFAGFGRAPSQSGDPRDEGPLVSEMTMSPKPGDLVWLRLFNNTRWAIRFNAFTIYGDKLLEWSKVLGGAPLRDNMRCSIRFVAVDANGHDVPSPFDVFITAILPSNRSVYFPVPREALAPGVSLYVPVQYEWEKEGGSAASVDHRVVISSFILPAEGQK
jgi:hypothetical protein